MTWLGLDIGGANLKAADGRGWARSVPFPLWRDPQGLSGALTALIETAPASERLAVTMTGELCDAFRTKADGVRHILAAVQQAADGREVRVYSVEGRFVTIEQAQQTPQLVAAGNWHALAKFACRFVEGTAGLLIDVGSTTTDIVPLLHGQPRPRGLNDTDRLLAGELIYTGVGRTPVCAITRSLPWRGAECPVAAELFATTADAYVILGDLPEDPAATWTADGRPLTKEFACERLARMICADSSTFTRDDAEAAATAVHSAQAAHVRAGVLRVIEGMSPPPDCVVLSGKGEFLVNLAVRDILSQIRPISLEKKLGNAVSASGPAHSLALLALLAEETPLASFS